MERVQLGLFIGIICFKINQLLLNLEMSKLPNRGKKMAAYIYFVGRF